MVKTQLHKRDKFFARKTAELWKLDDDEWNESTAKAMTSSRRSTFSGYHGIFRNCAKTGGMIPQNWDLAYSLGKKNCSFSNFNCFD